MALSLRAVALTLLGVGAVLVRPETSTVLLWALVVGAVVLLDWLLAVDPRTLLTHRSGAPLVRLGETSRTTVTLTNPGRRTVRATVRDAWPPSAGAAPPRRSVVLPSGERTRVTTTLTPTRRGDRVAAGLTVRSWGPLRVAARQRTLDVPGRLRVLHPFPARKHLPSRLALLRQIDGRSAVRVRGQGTEFDSLRDYVDGDDVRSIDWRATARRRHLVVRTWQPEQLRRVVLVVDTSRTAAGRVDDAPRLDAAMDAALLLTALAGHARDRVEVLAGDTEVRMRVKGNDRAALLHETTSALAPLEARLVEADWSTLGTEVARLGTHRALVVLLTPLESSAVEEGLLPVLPGLTARHRVVVASVADPEVARLAAAREDTEEVYAAAAAERTTALRDRTASALRSLGVDVLDYPPDELPVRLADHYLDLKRRGLL